jgi:hypothetical protein
MVIVNILNENFTLQLKEIEIFVIVNSLETFQVTAGKQVFDVLVILKASNGILANAASLFA